ncbi:MAG: methyltransferase domain-containing protein [Thiobacillus sp.]
MGITRLIAERFTDYDDPDSPASRMRLKRFAPFLDLIDETIGTHGYATVLDIGGTRKYWNILPSRYLIGGKLRITILNLSGVNKNQDDEVFSYRHGDACDLGQFDAGTFHIIHSNSCIEHVGGWLRICQFAEEVRRLTSSGGYFIQTPNYWFPVEPHNLTPLFHWLPRPVRVSLVQRFRLGHWPKSSNVIDAVRWVESARLLDRKEFAALFPDATFVTERLFGMPKSFIAIHTPSRESK